MSRSLYLLGVPDKGVPGNAMAMQAVPFVLKEIRLCRGMCIMLDLDCSKETENVYPHFVLCHVIVTV